MDLNTLLNAMRVVSNSGAHPIPGTGPYEPMPPSLGGVVIGGNDTLGGVIPIGGIRGPGPVLGGLSDLAGIIEQLYPGGNGHGETAENYVSNFFGRKGGKQPPKEPPKVPPFLPPQPGDKIRDPNRAPGGIFPGGGGLINPQHKFVNPQHLKVLQALIRSGAFKF